jgi:hypothetical protein
MSQEILKSCKAPENRTRRRSLRGLAVTIVLVVTFGANCGELQRFAGLGSDLVFYRPMPDGIEVGGVLHGARDKPSILVEEFGPGDDDDAADGETE